MADDMVTQLILDKIDALGEHLGVRLDGFTGRLDRINGRLDKHDEALATISTKGCAQMESHRALLAAALPADPPSRARTVGKNLGIGGAAIAFFEVVKVAIEKVWK